MHGPTSTKSQLFKKLQSRLNVLLFDSAEKDLKASGGLDCNRSALTLYLHDEVSSVGGRGGVRVQTHRSHDMGSVANDDNFAIHIPCDGVPDQERIREDSVFGGLPVRKSAKRM